MTTPAPENTPAPTEAPKTDPGLFKPAEASNVLAFNAETLKSEDLYKQFSSAAPEALRGTLDKHKDFSAFFSGVENLNKLAGEKGGVPADASKIDEMAKDLPASVIQSLKDSRASEAQAENIINAYNTHNAETQRANSEKSANTTATAIQKGVEYAQTAWGENYQDNLKNIKSFLAGAGISDEVIQNDPTLQAALHHPELLKAFKHATEHIKESGYQAPNLTSLGAGGGQKQPTQADVNRIFSDIRDAEVKKDTTKVQELRSQAAAMGLPI